MAIAPGSLAPDVAGVSVPGPRALVFYKTTCSVTRMAGPPIARFAEAYPGAVVGVGQDPPGELAAFATDVGWGFPQVPDLPPYAASKAFRIASAPTVIVVDGDGTVADVVESWDRDGLNRVSGVLAGLLGAEAVTVSTADDGLPDFKPG